ncbi:MAG TPA: squalene--hopene cyclase [Nitrococcus sp.]|nr:squalene--hopene cyclase [Nitrococcus sp.]
MRSMEQQPETISAGIGRAAYAPEAGAEAIEKAIVAAREALLARQHADGYWCFELEADCTIPAEYIMMMHYTGELEAPLEPKLARYIREHQLEKGGWPLYYGGAMDISCSVKAYFALKLAGDDPDAAHMRRARKAILDSGGAVNANVFTHIALALFGEVPWRAVPFMPPEILLLPRWFPFHLSKVSYWSRTVMVPLFILSAYKPHARNPRDIHIRELFITDPQLEANYFKARSRLNRLFIALDALGRRMEPLIPRSIRTRAIRRAAEWFIARLNCEHGLGAIFPAMVNAYEALELLGYADDHPARERVRRGLRNLVAEQAERAYCQPCLSPVWDTGLACLALQEADHGASCAQVRLALDWLKARQLLSTPGDWSEQHPDLPGGGWPFQFRNDHYPDLDDTAVVAWAMHRAADPQRYGTSIHRATAWLLGMQSSNGGFAAFDSDNTRYYLNEIPFADHGALLDPPTSDVTARVVTLLGSLNKQACDHAALQRAVGFLRREQETDGPWHGRWGTNYIYGTWSVLTALEQAGYEPDLPWIRKAVAWLKSIQRSDGGWGESNDSYLDRSQVQQACDSTPFQTAWAVLALIAAGECRSQEVHWGVEYLLREQRSDGLWRCPWFTAPGFPRVFYLKYHGYDAYFPLMALARYRNCMLNKGA